MEERKKSQKAKYGIPGAVLAVLIVVFIASANSNNDGNKQAENQQPPSEEYSNGYFFENIGGPHENIEGVSASACRGCHQGPHDDWKGSPHAAAMMHEPFRAGMAHVVRRDGVDAARPCFACHAPHAINLEGLSSDGTLAQDAISLEGINCFACHSAVMEVGFHIFEETEETYKPDPNEPEFCASCHNPDEAVIRILDPALASRWGILKPMGNPYTEWQDGPYSQPGENYQSCLSCHGKDGTGTLHQWPEDKVTLIRSGYTLETEGTSITVTNTGTGHMFPTGDPGRRLTIDARIVDADSGEILAERTFHLGIYYDEMGDLADNRIAPGESRVFSFSDDFEVDFNLDYTISYNFDPVTLEYLEGQGVSVEELVVIDTG